MSKKTMMKRLLAPRRLLVILAICLVTGWAAYDYVLDRLMIYSVQSNSPVLLQRLVEWGTNPNATDHNGDSALKHAIFRAQYGMMEILLNHGADPNQPDRFGSLPIDDAICFSDEQAVQLLLEHDVDPNLVLVRKIGYSGKTLLNTAANLDDPLKVQVLLAHGADPLKTDLNGHNAFYYAQDPEVMRLLVAAIGREPDPAWLNPNPDSDDI